MTNGIEAAVAALSGDPALAGSLGPQAAVIAWDRTAERVLWASSAARAVAEQLAGSDGRVTARFPAHRRLAALAGGLAPTAGVRIERLSFSDEPGEAPAELACRLMEVEGEPVLVTVFTGPLPARIGLRGGEDGPADSGRTAPFVERVRRQGRLRFIWSMDRDGRFVSVSPPLGQVVGAENAAITGLTWAEILDRFVLDEPDRIASFLSGRSTWSDETVLWRVADTSYVVPVDLGGMPVFGRGHVFEGFRGFGLCRADEIRPAPDSPVLRLQAEADVGEKRPDEAEAEAEGSELPLLHLAGEEAGSVDLAFEPIQARVGAQLGGARAVPLRPLTDPDAGGRGAARSESVVESGEAKPHLSVSERGALREIARALGARLETDDAQDQPAPRLPAEIVSISAARPREPDAVRILERLPVGILVLRGEAPLFANRSVLDLLGYRDIGELRGVSRLFAGRLEAREGSLALVGKGGRSLPVEARLTSVEWGDGPASLVLVRPLPEAGSDGAARSFELEIGRRDARLQELRGALDLAGLGLVTIDGAGRILTANAAAERIFGYRENEIAGEGFTTLIAVESHRAAIDLVDAARATAGPGEAKDVELLGRPRTGEPVPLLARAGSIGTAFGPSLALLFRDVSAFRRTEAELKGARRAAEEAAARQMEFLARISHEIRTPLNAIIGFAEIMLEERFGPVGSERYKHYLRDIHDSGGHVVSLVNDLLDLAKVTSGRSELVFTSLDLNEIVAQSVGMMQPAAARERIVMRTSFASRLPRLIADERSIRQIALNLVSNAIRFTGPGGQVIVSTSLTERGELVFRVRDTGIGMTPAEIAEALEPFRQVSVVRREDGTGLGLPLSKALVEANRGSFSISSRRGEGTLVEVLFPPARVLAED
ncbi:PAS domain S-box protein [Enterovirga sp. DB1703]|uniref:histidine kinase n=1 Tax=Enterovirga aerilata TaxID=2730920 RepID=A0A849I213_9HYPH|nr:PAS domain S-box protein [Enterovirga sp. DB1703]